METIWRSIALLLLAVASAHADVLPEPLASPADNSTSPAMAPTSELFTSLTAYFGLVGYNIVPWAPEQTADLERALNESIKDAVAVRIRDVQQFASWNSLPKMLRVIAASMLFVSSESVEERGSEADSPANSSGDGGKGSGARSRRLLTARRRLWETSSNGGFAAGTWASSSDWGSNGPPNSGLIITADIYTRSSDPALLNLIQWEIASSLEYLRSELNVSGGAVAVDLLGTGLPSASPPNYDQVPPGVDSQLVEALDSDYAGSSSSGANGTSGEGARPRPVVQSSFPPGLAAGIAVACVVVVALMGLAIWKRRKIAAVLLRRRQRQTFDSAGLDGMSGGVRAGEPPADSLLQPDQVTISKRKDGSDWLLGEGSMGAVYRGMLHGKLPVAIKVLRGSAAGPEVTHEVAVLKACRSPYVVQFQGVVLHKESLWLVQELCETDLYSAIGSGRVSWHKRGRRIALDVARGLHFLHSNKIVHLDLKSPNVLLTAAGQGKIADVGTAAVMTRTHLTQATLGTFAWCAPEVLLAQRATAAADIFSYGVLLWEIITGSRPARGQLREVRAPEECPAEVAALLTACLASDPEARPTAADIIERIGGLARSETRASDLGPALGSAALGSTASQQQLLLAGGASAAASSMALGSSAALGAAANSGTDGSSESPMKDVAGGADGGEHFPRTWDSPLPGAAAAAATMAGAQSASPERQQPEAQTSGLELTQQQQQQAPGQLVQHHSDDGAGGQAFDEAHARLLLEAWQQAEAHSGNKSRRKP